MKTNLDELREKNKRYSPVYQMMFEELVETIEKDVMKLPFFLKSHYKEGDLEFIKRDEIKQLLKGGKR